MRKTLLTAFAAAALLSGAMLASPVGAMTLAAPSAMGAAVGDAALVQKTAVVCGYRGCVRVHPRRYYNYYGYYGRPYWYYGRPYGWHRWYW